MGSACPVMREAPSRGFWLGVALASLLIVSLSLWVASFEWFSRDDFRFLAYVQLISRTKIVRAIRYFSDMTESATPHRSQNLADEPVVARCDGNETRHLGTG